MSRKILSIIGVVVACGIALTIYLRNQQLSTLLDRFEAATDGPGKLKLATKIVYTDFDTTKESDSLSLGSRLQDLLAYTTRKTRSFEASLSEETKVQIVKDIKPSRVPSTTFSFDLSRACNKELYESMKNELGLETLARRGFNFAILAGFYEDRNRPLYFRALAEHIDQNGCSVGSCKELSAWYRSASSSLDKIQKNLESQIARVEGELQQTGLDREQVKTLTDKYARAWPHCMDSMTLELGGFISTDVTTARGAYLLSEYKRIGLRSTNDLEHLKPIFDPTNPLKESARDAWGNDYKIDISSNGALKIVSGGSDYQLGTEDDITIE